MLKSQNIRRIAGNVFYGLEEPGKFGVPYWVLWITETGPSLNRKYRGKTEKMGSVSERYHAVSTVFFSSTYQQLQHKGTVHHHSAAA